MIFLPDPPMPGAILSLVLCIISYDVSMVTEEPASWKLLSPPRVASGGSLNAPDVMDRFPSLIRWSWRPKSFPRTLGAPQSPETRGMFQ